MSWSRGIRTCLWHILLVRSSPHLVRFSFTLFVLLTYRFSLWYPRYMLQTRIAMFWAGASLSGAFSGLLAFGISFMSGTAGLLGWSWIFVSISVNALLPSAAAARSFSSRQILEGLATILVGAAAYFRESSTLFATRVCRLMFYSTPRSARNDDVPHC